MKRTNRRRTPAQLAGEAAEERAARLLADHGLEIVARNFRTRHGEIDLIAHDGGTLVFVEVRMRSSDAFGDALESITEAKRARIVAAARKYLADFRREPPCRFDVVTLGGPQAAWARAAFEVAESL